MHSCSHGLFLPSHDLEHSPPSSDSSKQSYFSLQSKSNEIQEPDLHLKPSSQGRWLNLDHAIVLWSPVWHMVAFSSLWSPQSSVPSHIHNAEIHFLLLHSNKSGPEKKKPWYILYLLFQRNFFNGTLSKKKFHCQWKIQSLEAQFLNTFSELSEPQKVMQTY